MEIGIFNNTEEDINKELKELKKVLVFLLKREKLKKVIFNVIIVNNEEIHQINRDYRGIDRPTDVISFALEDDKSFKAPFVTRVLGDIYISIDKAHEQALSYNHSFKRELCFLGVHGLLHLLGYDHMSKEEEKEMFALQEEVLSKYGIER